MLALETAFLRVAWANNIASSNIMARFAEMSSAPAVPDSEVTTVHAFIVNEILRMLLACSLAAVKVKRFAKTTFKLFWGRLVFLQSFLLAISHASIIGMLASKTLVKG